MRYHDALKMRRSLAPANGRMISSLAQKFIILPRLRFASSATRRQASKLRFEGDGGAVRRARERVARLLLEVSAALTCQRQWMVWALFSKVALKRKWKERVEEERSREREGRWGPTRESATEPRIFCFMFQRCLRWNLCLYRKLRNNSVTILFPDIQEGP